jgi:hypothetical protein
MAILRSLCLLPLLVLSLCSLAYSSEGFLGELSSKPILHRRFETSQIRSELGPLLSPGAVIVDADGGNLTEATQRWQQFASPSFNAVVQVATENDIIVTVRSDSYAILF